MKQNKLNERCVVLEKLIIQAEKLYSDPMVTNDQKAFLETVIGAGIWYLPHSEKDFWSRRMSKEAKKIFDKDKKKYHLTKDHKFPRKQAARKLLSSDFKNFAQESLLDLYKSQYGIFHYVTKDENRKLIKYQTGTSFLKSYQQA
jgi:homoaconitase/3-isopropylmalate dehydratase large subunit